METLLRKFTNLSDEEYGELVKMCFQYADGVELTGSPKMKIFFKHYVEKDLRTILKTRLRMKKYLDKKGSNADEQN